MSSLDDLGYHVLGPIAKGGMAEIVLVERVGPGGVKKRLAVKRLLPGLSSEVDFVTMLQNEARIAVALDHANIVNVFELGEADGELFIAMEYVCGWDLAVLLGACARVGRPFPPALAIHVAQTAANALAYAHERSDEQGASLGIVHRDVSPSNLLVSVDGVVKLADFGIARARAKAKSTPGNYLRGKVPYMSPEQTAGDPVDARSDVYSLGIILFELLTAERLFPADMPSANAARRGPLPRLSEIRPDARALDDVIARALAFDREQRFPSARELAGALAKTRESFLPAMGDADLKAFVASLGLAPPVSPENVTDGEKTDPVSLRRIPRASAPDVGAQIAPIAGSDPSPAAPPAPPSPTTLSGPVAATRDRDRRRAVVVTVALGVVGFCMALTIGRVVTEGIARVGQAETRLEVRTPAPGVPVWLDGVPRGTTPLVLQGLPARTVEVRVGEKESGGVWMVDLGTSPDAVLDVGVP